MTALLEVRGARVERPGCVAIEDVSWAVEAGRVHALVGENGAGKSTLLGVIGGVVMATRGEVWVDGHVLARGDVVGARRAGVGVVYQHFMLVETLSVLDNVIVGAEPRRGWMGLAIDRKKAREDLVALSAKYGLPVDPEAKVESLSVGERQRVEIVKVLAQGARVVLLDEPTAVLSPGEVGGFLETVRGLAKAGAAVVLVTHKLDEVFAVADAITVLRRGRVVDSRETTAWTRDAVVAAMMGDAVAKTVEAKAPNGNVAVGLRVEALEAEGVGPVSFEVRAGEVLGVAGVEGNGQRALTEAIAGVLPLRAGRVVVGDVAVEAMSVAARRRAGLGWVPEDREGRGLIGALSVAENVALGDPSVATGGGLLSHEALTKLGAAVVARFGVRPSDPWARVSSLSGGNQQKVLLGRELVRPLKVLVVSQPTRGVDLGARAELHAAIVAAKAEGLAVLLVSSDLDELRQLSDRVAVMRGGRVVGEVAAAEASDARLGPWMVG